MAESNGFLGAGDVYMNRQVAGVYTGWKGPFGASKFEIKANSELKERISKGRNTYGQAKATAAVPKPFDLNITFDELNSDGIALAMLGTNNALTQSSGSLTNEIVAVNGLDIWYPLSKFSLTGNPTVTGPSASPTYVEGTDYIVNKALGWIKPLGTGSIPASGNIEVDSAYAAVTGGKEIKGAINPIIIAQFRFDGINFSDNKKAVVLVHQANISSDAAIDFLADDFSDIPLPGRLVTPTGQTEPFSIRLFD